MLWYVFRGMLLEIKPKPFKLITLPRLLFFEDTELYSIEHEYTTRSAQAPFLIDF